MNAGRRYLNFVAASVLLATASFGASQARADAALPTDVTMAPAQQAKLAKWFEAVGPVRPGESLGAVAVRAGMVQLGKPYYQPKIIREPKVEELQLDTFQCQSFVESSLAVARCTWEGDPSPACFAREVLGFRFRDGVRKGFTSRLHYFTEWLSDNVRRARLRDLTTELGGTPVQRDFFFLTRHVNLYPDLAAPALRAEMAEIEKRLSQEPHPVLNRTQVKAAAASFESGDTVAVVTSKAGLLISHTGFIVRGDDGVSRLLHASSHHGRVLLTREAIGNYLQRWPDRQGLMVTRPVPPSSQPRVARSD